MTSSPDANRIFTTFQTRRALLRRAGKLGAVASLPLPLAACLDVPDNAFEQLADGNVAISITEGTNCWQGQCFQYDARRGEVSAAGYEPMAVPDGIDLSDGTVSEAEFDALLQAARAERRVRDDTSGGGASSGGNSGPPGE